MNKIILVLISFLIMFPTITNANSLNADLENTNDNPQKFEISLQGFSLNSEIDKLNNIDLGEKIELIYFYNQYFYGKFTNALYHHSQWGGEVEAGTQYHFLPKLKTYTELGYNYRPARNGKTYKGEFVYDAGASYDLFKYFSPQVELDNFTTHNHEKVKIGFSIPLNHSVSIATNYIQNLYSNGNGFELKFNYKF